MERGDCMFIDKVSWEWVIPENIHTSSTEEIGS
jgi:hypothetical protein